MLNTKTNLCKINEVTLAKHKVWSIEGDRRGDVISCSSGTLWITQQGDLRDYVVGAGKKFWVTRQGTVIIQALDDAQFRYSLNELESYIEDNKQPVRRSLHIRLTRPLR